MTESGWQISAVGGASALTPLDTVTKGNGQMTYDTVKVLSSSQMARHIAVLGQPVNVMAMVCIQIREGVLNRAAGDLENCLTLTRPKWRMIRQA